MPPSTMLVTVAHPDDESFGCGSVIAHAVDLGLRVVVVCATRGEAGEGDSDDLGAQREGELREAAVALGVHTVEVLEFADSGWDGPPPPGALVDRVDEATAAIRDVVLRHRPAIVVTLDPTGSDGHRDHAAIGLATTAAFHATVDWPASLYHWCIARSLMNRWAAATAQRQPDSVYLENELGRPDDDITTVLDVASVLPRRNAAIAAHRSQASPFDGLDDDLRAAFLTRDHFVRVVPPWVGGPVERALLVAPHEATAS
jgi:N-acetyl-1-D-myo-inositol-2-amino-2-deoxy-alpha-D-glucopyranoside deacetylase